MAEPPRKPADIVVLGLAAYGRVVNTLARGSARAARRFADQHARPALRRLGVLMRESLSRGRGSTNGRSARRPVPVPPPAPALVEPKPRADRVSLRWKTLLGAGSNEHEEDDRVVLNLLGQLTPAEARILRHACTRCGKILMPSGLVEARQLVCTADQLRPISGLEERHRQERALDHLRALELLVDDEDGLDTHAARRLVDITPTALALSLFVRCEGSTASPAEFFGLLAARTGSTSSGTA